MSRLDLLTDSHGRVMRDLLVSVTDRCNFRCLYCLPETEEAANFYRVKFDALSHSSPTTPVLRHRVTRPTATSSHHCRFLGLQ